MTELQEPTFEVTAKDTAHCRGIPRPTGLAVGRTAVNASKPCGPRRFKGAKFSNGL